MAEIAAWQAGRRCPDPVKRKFSNFLTFPGPNLDVHKSPEHFDLSSDEEDHSDKTPSDKWESEKFYSQPNSIYATPKIHSPDDGSSFKSKLSEIIVEHQSMTTPQQSTEKEEKINFLILQESERQFSDADENVDFSEISERKGSVVSDAKFDLILASLQSLAIEIERDFRNENCQNSDFNSMQRTKSENNLTSSTVDMNK